MRKGDTVTAGTLLGYEGRTGRASGCHLHYGVFSPSETDQYVMDPVAAKRMKLPRARDRADRSCLILPERTKPGSKSRADAVGRRQ